MPRVTEDDVLEITDLDDPDTDLTPFITAANYLVTEKCAGATRPDGSLWHSDDSLFEVERWLSAHFYHILAPTALNEQAGDVQQRIESKVDLGLNVTRYGQMAMVLDISGQLAGLNQQTVSGRHGWGAYWLGRKPEESTRRVR